MIVLVRDSHHADASWQDDWSYWIVGGGKSQTDGSYFRMQ